MRDRRDFGWKPLSVVCVVTLMFYICLRHLPVLGSAWEGQNQADAGSANSAMQDVEFARLVKEWTARIRSASPRNTSPPFADARIVPDRNGDPRSLMP